MSRHLVVYFAVVVLEEDTCGVIPDANGRVEQRIFVALILLKEELDSAKVNLAKEIGVEGEVLLLLVYVLLTLIQGQLYLSDQVYALRCGATIWLLVLYLLQLSVFCLENHSVVGVQIELGFACGVARTYNTHSSNFKCHIHQNSENSMIITSC